MSNMHYDTVKGRVAQAVFVIAASLSALLFLAAFFALSYCVYSYSVTPNNRDEIAALRAKIREPRDPREYSFLYEDIITTDDQGRKIRKPQTKFDYDIDLAKYTNTIRNNSELEGKIKKLESEYFAGKDKVNSLLFAAGLATVISFLLLSFGWGFRWVITGIKR